MIQFKFAREHREKQIKASTILALRWYVNQRNCKKKVYEKAKLDRKKVQIQQTLFKLIKVGAYWKRRDTTLGSTDLKMVAAFFSWKNKAWALKKEKVYDSQADLSE